MSVLKVTTALFGDLFVLPHPPNGAANDSLEFYTDIIPSYTNETEFRAQMRAIPRETITYPYGFRYDRLMESYNALTAGLRSRWAVPLWFHSSMTALAAGQTVVALDTVYADYRANSLALVYSTRGQWALVQVASITANSITLSAATPIVGRCYVMPVRTGYVSGQSALKPIGNRSSTKLIYEIEDVLTGVTDASPQYNGLDLYTAPYEIETEGAASITWQSDEVEFSVGNIARDTPWARSQYSRQYKYNGFNVQDLLAVKQYFYRRAGKFRPFVSPTFEANFRHVSTGNVASALKVVDDGYLAMLYATRKTVALGLDDGSWQLRGVTGAVDLGSGQTQLNFDTPLNIDASRLRVVSYAGINRLDTDTLDITMEPGGYSHANYQVLEITG